MQRDNQWVIFDPSVCRRQFICQFSLCLNVTNKWIAQVQAQRGIWLHKTKSRNDNTKLIKVGLLANFSCHVLLLPSNSIQRSGQNPKALKYLVCMLSDIDHWITQLVIRQHESMEDRCTNMGSRRARKVELPLNLLLCQQLPRPWIAHIILCHRIGELGPAYNKPAVIWAIRIMPIKSTGHTEIAKILNILRVYLQRLAKQCIVLSTSLGDLCRGQRRNLAYPTLWLQQDLNLVIGGNFYRWCRSKVGLYWLDELIKKAI